MNETLEFLNSLTATEIGLALSIIFGFITLVGFLQQRRTNKKQEKLIKFAEINVDKTITEKQIDSLTDKKNTLNSQVKVEIPKIARRIVLNEQASHFGKQIFDNYESLKEINTKLSAVPVITLSEELTTFIEGIISPKFKREMKIQEFRDNITSYSVIIVLLSMLPFSIGWILQISLGVFLGNEILKLQSVKAKNVAARNKVIKNTKIIYLVICFAVLIFGSILIANYFWEQQNYTDILYFGIGFSILGLIALILTNFFIKKIQKSISKIEEDYFN
jgi:hypothetical protein